jgi:hypothetical protein
MLSPASVALLRSLTREFVRRHWPAELPVFEPVWEWVCDAVRTLGPAPSGRAISARRLVEGLPFAAYPDQRLMCVHVAFAALLVAERLKAKGPGSSPELVYQEFEAVVKMLRERPALARKLATEIGRDLLAVVAQDEDVTARGSAGEPKDLATDADLWYVDALTNEMLQEGETRPQRKPRTLEQIEAQSDWRAENFVLFVDESLDDGWKVTLASGQSSPTKPWSELKGQRGRFLHLVLESLYQRKRFVLSNEQILRAVGLAGTTSLDPANRARAIKGSLKSALEGVLDGLLSPSGDGGYQLHATIAYCWIHPALGPSRLLGARHPPA